MIDPSTYESSKNGIAFDSGGVPGDLIDQPGFETFASGGTPTYNEAVGSDWADAYFSGTIDWPELEIESAEDDIDESDRLALFEINPGKFTSIEFEETQEQVDAAREQYINVVSGRRESILSPRFTKQRLAEKRKQYEVYRDRAGREAARILLTSGYTRTDLEYLSIDGNTAEGDKLVDLIEQRSHEDSQRKLLKGAYNWWAKQSGGRLWSKGTRNKILAMLPVGAAAVAFGPVVGGAVGGFAARTIIRGTVGAHFDRKSQRYGEGSKEKIAKLAEDEKFLTSGHLTDTALMKKADGETLTTADVTAVIEGTTSRMVANNRKKLGAAILMGAFLGRAASVVGSDLLGHHVASSLAHSKADNIKDHSVHTEHTPHSHQSHSAVGHISKHTATETTKPHVVPRSKTVKNPQGSSSNSNTSSSKSGSSASNNTPTGTGQAVTQPNPAAYQAYGGEYPWNYFANHYGSNDASDRIISLAQQAEAHGWQVNSFAHGINSMVSPNGTVYSTTPQIISALEYFDN